MATHPDEDSSGLLGGWGHWTTQLRGIMRMGCGEP